MKFSNRRKDTAKGTSANNMTLIRQFFRDGDPDISELTCLACGQRLTAPAGQRLGMDRFMFYCDVAQKHWDEMGEEHFAAIIVGNGVSE